MSAGLNAGLDVKALPKKFRVLIIAHRDLLVDGIIRTLESVEEEVQVTCVEPGEPCTRHFAGEYPDLLLLQDKSKPGEFEDFVREMVEGFPEMRLFVFGHSMSEDRLYRVIQAGAHGYINDKMNSEHMINALTAVRNGGYWVERHIMERFITDRSLVEGVQSRVMALSERLTSREIEVLELIMKGLTTREIAERVFLSDQGVKAHLTTLFRKFDAKNRSQLILRALDEVISPVESITGLMQQGLQTARVAS